MKTCCSVCGVELVAVDGEERWGVWESSAICPSCLADAGWTGHQGPLTFREDVTLPWGTSLWAGTRLALRGIALVGGGLGLACATLSVLGNVMGVVGPAVALPFATILLTYGIFIGFACCFVSVAAIPACLTHAICGRRRSLDAGDGRFGLKIGWRRRTEFTLHDIVWTAAKGNLDTYGWYTPQGELIRIRAEQVDVCCGFEEEARRRWLGLLQLLGANQSHPLTRAELVRGFVRPIVIGLVIGLVVGYGLELAWGARLYLLTGLLLGAGDSVAYAVIRRGIDKQHPTTLKMVSGKLFPLLMFLGFFTAALKLSIGLLAGLTLGLLNGSIGLLLTAILIRVWREMVKGNLG